jgi:predicted metal-dependent hydrolase
MADRGRAAASLSTVQLDLPLGPDVDPAPVFVRHRRARRYILRVLDDGRLRVTLPRWGSKREALAFVKDNADWIEKQHAARRHRAAAAVEAHGVDVAAARRQARRELPAQLLALAGRHNLTVPRISIRNQRSRWGSCGPNGHITLNWRLVLVPDFVREYVLLHELMHRKQLNHSARFWKLVAGVCPRFLEARRWLRTDGRSLFRE